MATILTPLLQPPIFPPLILRSLLNLRQCPSQPCLLLVFISDTHRRQRLKTRIGICQQHLHVGGHLTCDRQRLMLEACRATLWALNDEPQQIYQITSGDPARGTLAWEGDFAYSKATPVRVRMCKVYQQPGDAQSSLLSQDPSTSLTSDDTTIVLEDTFLAATENGLLIDRHNQQLGSFRERR